MIRQYQRPNTRYFRVFTYGQCPLDMDNFVFKNYKFLGDLKGDTSGTDIFVKIG